MTIHFPTENKICQGVGIEDIGSEASPGTNQSKSLLVRRIARRSKRLKVSAGYLDYMHYYFSEASNTYREPSEVDDDIRRTARCQHTWNLEVRGEESRFRGIGCGDRLVCPVCGSYYHIVQARESARQMVAINKELESRGVALKSQGLKIVFTIPKDISSRLDDKLFGIVDIDNIDEVYSSWSQDIKRFRSLVSAWLKEWFPGVPYVLGHDYTGESAPTEPHYHINAYLLPASLEVTLGIVSSEPIERFFAEDKLTDMRHAWRDTLNEAYTLELAEADVQIGYLKSEAQVFHWFRYMYRHPLYDLWKGWNHYDEATGELSYTYSKKVAGRRIRTTTTIPREQLNKAFQRLELISKHFKRIAWYGSLSDGNRGKTMSALGFVKEVRNDDEDDERWHIDSTYNFVRYEPDGIVLELRERIVWQEEGSPDLVLPGDDTGQLLKVFDDKVNYSPAGVKLGRRIVWLERVSPG